MGHRLCELQYKNSLRNSCYLQFLKQSCHVYIVTDTFKQKYLTSVSKYSCDKEQSRQFYLKKCCTYFNMGLTVLNSQQWKTLKNRNASD